jgi:hypothetical protein
MKVPQPSSDGAEPHHPSLLLVGNPEPVPLAFGSSATCEVCQTAEFLVFEKIAPVQGLGAVRPIEWDVDYWCGKCETYYGFRAQGPSRDQHIL